MKPPIFQADGYGFVRFAKEFDQLLDAVETEWVQSPDAYMELLICTARRPQLEM
jgi:hypothetical protein